MIKSPITVGWCALLSILLVGTVLVGGAGAQPVIDPEADAVLRAMSEHLKSVPAAYFRVTDTVDDVQEDGLKLQFAHVREMTVVRPDKLKIDTKGDVTNRVLWKDGKTITVLDRDLNVYARIKDKGTVGESIRRLQEEYGMSTPAADLLSEDAYTTLTETCSDVLYVGLGYAGEELCHHLAFIAKHVDFQLWVSTGEKPSPRKLVITYKLIPGEPQYTLQLLEAKDADDIGKDAFKAVIPEDAEEIVFHPVNAAN